MKLLRKVLLFAALAIASAGGLAQQGEGCFGPAGRVSRTPRTFPANLQYAMTIMGGSSPSSAWNTWYTGTAVANITSNQLSPSWAIFNVGVTHTTQLQTLVYATVTNHVICIWWGDGNYTTITNCSSAGTGENHTYASDGAYTICVLGDCAGFRLSSGNNPGGTAWTQNFAAAKYFYVFNQGSCPGGFNLGSMPLMTDLTITTSNAFQVTGDLSQMPNLSANCNLYTSNAASIQVNKVTGNLTSCPNCVLFKWYGGDPVYNTSSGQYSFPNNMKEVLLNPSAAPGKCSLTTPMVDALLIDLASAGGTWASPKIVSLIGNCPGRTSASDAAVATLTGKSVTVTANNALAAQIINDGDSRASLTSYDYGTQMNAHYSTRTTVVSSVGKGGEWLASNTGATRALAVLALAPVGQGVKQTVTLQESINDQHSGTVSLATLESEATTYLATVKAAYPSCHVVAITVLPSQWILTNQPQTTTFNAYNAWLIANSAGFDAVLDLTSNAHLTDPTNTTYWNSDQLHLNSAGNTDVATALESLVEGHGWTGTP